MYTIFSNTVNVKLVKAEYSTLEFYHYIPFL